MEITETRKLNLQLLVDQEGSKAALGRRYGIDPTFVSQILNGHRNMGEKAARKFEASARLTDGWMDAPHGAKHSINESGAKYLEEKGINSGVEDFFGLLNTHVLGQKYQDTSATVRKMVDELLDMPPREAEKFVALYRTAKDEIYNGRKG